MPLLSSILTIFLKWVLVKDVRLEKECVWVLLHWTCLESLTICDRQTFPTIHRMIFLYVTLPVPASTAQRVGGIRDGWDLPPNHHEEAALVTTASLSAKLCYPAIIEKRDQRCIDKMTTLSTLPSCCWTGTSSDTSARKPETARPVEDPPGIFQQCHQP